MDQPKTEFRIRDERENLGRAAGENSLEFGFLLTLSMHVPPAVTTYTSILKYGAMRKIYSQQAWVFSINDLIVN